VKFEEWAMELEGKIQPEVMELGKRGLLEWMASFLVLALWILEFLGATATVPLN
jgi:hypothetical protein